MSSYNELIALINGCINRNGVQAITGRVLNGVLRAMVNQLGAGYAMGGVAHPTDDPGTPDAPVCYYASEVGTYTHFGNIQIVPGELALLCFDLTDGWFKETMYEGFESVQATIDGNVGTPAVNVTYVNGVLSFDFSNMKGNTGAAAGFGNVTAAVDGTIGTPGVSVQTDGPDTAKNIAFQFTGLKGETGVTSVIATVDNTSGTPQCAVSLNGQQLTLAFTGLKGAQGDTGVSADYPITIVNNLTTNDPTSALSAAQGVVLDGKVSQLEAKVNSLQDKGTIDVGHYVNSSTHNYDSSAAWDAAWAYILGPGSIRFSGATASRVCFFNSFTPSSSSFISTVNSGLSEVTIPSGAVLAIYNLLLSDNPDGFDNLKISQDGAMVAKSDLVPLSNAITAIEKETMLDSLSQTNRAYIDYNHYVKSNDWTYDSSNAWDAGWVKVLGGGDIIVTGATPKRFIFYNSFEPSTDSYVGTAVKVSRATIPSTAKLVIINFEHDSNPNGYGNMLVRQDFSCALTTDITKLSSLKVLMIGSSFGVNTIIQFPFLCRAAGIEITCGDLYESGGTLADIVDIINGDNSWDNSRLYLPGSGKWDDGITDFETMLKYTDWDIIIVQRAASERTSWNSTMEANLQTIIEYIQANVTGTPKIVFNPTFAYPNFSADKTSQVAETNLINSTALQMQEAFGFEILPVATAVQNARMTNLIGYGSAAETIPDMAEDSMHLDTGVGSYVTGAVLFERLIGERCNKSIITNPYIPVKADIVSMGIFAQSAYTQPTADNVKVMKYCALLACRKPDTVNTVIGTRFPYEG